MPVCCPALTRLPSSMRRNPARPEIGRADGRVVQLRPRGVDRRGVGGDRGGELQHQGILRVELLLGGEVLLGERSVAGEIELGVGEIGLVLRLFGDRLVERGLKRPGVDLGQKIALLDHLAFVEGDLHDLAVDSGPDQNGVVRLNLPDALENDGKIRALDRRYGDDNRRGARRLSLSLPRRRGVLTWRRPNPVVQLMGEPAGGGNPAVRRLGRIDPIGGGRAARQYGHPCEPGQSHRRKPFFNPADRAGKPPSRAHRSRGAAAREAPNPSAQALSRRQFSRGTFANIIILGGEGRHQPNLTGSRAVSAPRP